MGKYHEINVSKNVDVKKLNIEATAESISIRYVYSTVVAVINII